MSPFQEMPPAPKAPEAADYERIMGMGYEAATGYLDELFARDPVAYTRLLIWAQANNKLRWYRFSIVETPAAVIATGPTSAVS